MPALSIARSQRDDSLQTGISTIVPDLDHLLIGEVVASLDFFHFPFGKHCVCGDLKNSVEQIAKNVDSLIESMVGIRELIVDVEQVILCF